ncbi:hypothetical protein E6H18_01145 [Candidatus Bathyarchaeota archaeon]|nr:MAG: hypothetical protein E6H20_07015 [Candidatus Bathyarchaeota archaeon]TMI58949.1 MAG: hypothetical protein E6H18_01145 [Candidatus Bathyarchaeota archaeon]
MKENIVAVCISGKEEAWSVPEIPFYCHAEGYKDFPHYPPVKTRERIRYLAARRNAAHKRALELHPNTEHFLSIDSYYLSYAHEIRSLLKEYSNYDAECVLGATNWFSDYSRIPLKLRYWDTWATPEMRDKRFDYYPRHEGMPEGWESVRGCGGFAVYPRWVWERRGYGVPEPFPEAGNEVNYLCQCPGISSYVSLNVRVLRETPKEIRDRSLINRLRTTLRVGTRLGMRRPLTSRASEMHGFGPEPIREDALDEPTIRKFNVT